jgi:DNA-directed RNA polymerase specialized sigma24 family protein
MSDVDIEILASMIDETTAARGVDRYAVDWCDLSAAEWADMTGRDSSTVARNVRRARD